MISSRILKFANVFLHDRKRAGHDKTARQDTDKPRRAHLASARLRCREIRDLRYCTCCHLALQPFESICEQCGNATEPLPSVYALHYARAEFPDLVATRDDFDRLLE